ncbi:MAG: hypothetical protein ACYSUT_02800 [Planctomycetota bacterium]|jgi:outer membrane protein assembly factor BamE (lipoprotein component of BamABCDE complex)
MKNIIYLLLLVNLFCQAYAETATVYAQSTLIEKIQDPNLPDNSPDKEDAAKHKLILKPHQGCLPVTFGMTKQEVIKVLGKPDQILGKHCLDYSSTLGLSFLVHSKKGLVALDCWSQNEKSKEGILCGATFAGAFANGIKIGSTRKEVEKAFGKPKEKSNSSRHHLNYLDLGLVFQFKKGKVSHISMNKTRTSEKSKTK